MKSAYLILALTLFASPGFADPVKKSTKPSINEKQPQEPVELPPAEGTETKLSTPLESPKEEDVDQIITNKKMRADSGSKSKLSISNSITYYGGTINEPMAQIRPNIRGGSGTTTVATLNDTISVKYALTARKALLFGAGVRWITPFYGTATPYDYSKQQKYPGDKFDIDNPLITYQYIYKWAGIQSVLAAQNTYWTRVDQTNAGYVDTLDLQQNNIYEFSKIGLSIGLLLDMNYSFYDSGTLKVAPYINVQSQQSDFGFAAFPFLEYKILEWLHIRTVSGLASFEHRRAHAVGGRTVRLKTYQSVGLGISVSRDVYLYPNVQFLPDNMRPSLTNVGLGASINLF
jgi:hypothetical protein